MNIPKEIKVGNITYTVKIKDLGANRLGQHRYRYDRKSIFLHNRLSGEKLRNVFFHELTHAILAQIGADDEFDNEMFVQSLANELDKLFELKNP